MKHAVEDGARVGLLRQQSALMNASHRVVVVSNDPTLKALLQSAIAFDCFPDTTNENGDWEPVFKIRLVPRE